MTGRAMSTHVIRVQRCCNGCDQPLRDATEFELRCAVIGQQLPNVRHECPNCKGMSVWWHKGHGEPVQWWLRRILTRRVDWRGYGDGEIDCAPAFQQMFNQAAKTAKRSDG